MSDSPGLGDLPPLVLATDLDGTFAGGTPAARAELQAALAAHGSARLVYITGRSEESARELIAREALPVPDVLVTDVGTSVLRGVGPERLDEIERVLGADWPGADAVRRRLEKLSDLEEQDVRAPRRVSYWIVGNRALRGGGGADFEARGPEDASFSSTAAIRAADAAAAARAALDGLAVDVLISGNVYLDVLPRGVNKGTTLRLLLRTLGVEETTCIVAGDSLNDRALFETGARGIVVGNCEPALRVAVGDHDGVYLASAAGAAGLLEGLRHHGALPSEHWGREGGGETKGTEDGE